MMVGWLVGWLIIIIFPVASSGDESGDYSDLSDETNHKMVLVVRWLENAWKKMQSNILNCS